MTLRDDKSPAIGLLPIAVWAVGAMHAAGASAATDRTIVCELEGLTRTISLRANPEERRVCDVLYEKPDEGVDEAVLWYARNDPQYCTPHFIDLVEKLASNGWSCRSPDEMDRPDTALSRSTTGPEESPVDERQDAPSSGSGERLAADSAVPSEEAAGLTAVRADFRDWCVKDSAIDGNTGPAEDYCACLLDGLTASGTPQDGLQRIMDGIPSRLETGGEDGKAVSTAQRSKELNTLVLNYDYVSESCR